MLQRGGLLPMVEIDPFCLLPEQKKRHILASTKIHRHYCTPIKRDFGGPSKGVLKNNISKKISS